MKRTFDILVSLVLLIVGLPIIFVLIILVSVFLGWPAFFCQRRPGLNGKEFRLIKFRSMTDARDAEGELLPDSKRLTGFGKFLRATSLDELPELWNVLKGDMSLVGPRPLLVEYLPLYNERQARRHEVRPGITGWAQVNGRNAVGWDERFELDVWYVENRTFWLDLKILGKTTWAVVSRKGISAEGEATMGKFTGSTSSSESEEEK